jgi:hypothetical protein
MYLAARKIDHVSRAFQSFEIGRTTKAQALAALPLLEQEDSSNPICRSDECFSYSTRIDLIPPQLWRVIGYPPKKLIAYAIHDFGIRYLHFKSYAGFNGGVLSFYGYSLRTSNGFYYHPGAITLFAAYRKPPLNSDDPGFWVRRYFKWQELDGTFAFNELAEHRRVAAAMTLATGCLWALPGCRVADDLAPRLAESVSEFEWIHAVASQPDKACDVTTLYQKAQFEGGIWLVKASAVDTSPKFDGYSTKYWVRWRPPRAIRKPANKYNPVKQTWISSPDPVTRALLKAVWDGNTMILFEDNSTNIDSLCELVPATEQNVKGVRDGVAKYEQTQAEWKEWLAKHPRNPEPPSMPPIAPCPPTIYDSCRVATGKPCEF